METTLVPFSTLPACAASCGPLYDANGACVPPAQPTADPSTYQQCFCEQNVLQPFSVGVSGVCDNACTGNDAVGITSVQQWFSGFCAAGASSPGATLTPGNPSNHLSNGQGGSWISGHWQWVIMIVFVVVGITAIWIGACIWRRRYLRRRRNLPITPDKTASWGPGAPSAGTGPFGPDSSASGVPTNKEYSGPGMFMPPAPASAPSSVPTPEQPVGRADGNVTERA